MAIMKDGGTPKLNAEFTLGGLKVVEDDTLSPEKVFVKHKPQKVMKKVTNPNGSSMWVAQDVVDHLKNKETYHISFFDEVHPLDLVPNKSVEAVQWTLTEKDIEAGWAAGSLIKQEFQWVCPVTKEIKHVKDMTTNLILLTFQNIWDRTMPPAYKLLYLESPWEFPDYAPEYLAKAMEKFLEELENRITSMDWQEKGKYAQIIYRLKKAGLL